MFGGKYLANQIFLTLVNRSALLFVLTRRNGTYEAASGIERSMSDMVWRVWWLVVDGGGVWR